MSSKVVLETEIAKVGDQDRDGHTLTEEDLRQALELDDDLVFDEENGILKLVIKYKEEG